MNIKNYKKICFLIAILGFSGGCFDTEVMRVPNPASQDCIDKGGILQIANRGDGAEYGICTFEENRQCEEWAMFYEECPIGGLEIAGYSTPEETYCAIRGGKVAENENSCTLPTGKKCTTKDFYNGKCI